MVDYLELRPQIKTGDILAWRGTSIVSWVISKRTKSPYTHVGIAWVVGSRVLVLQADPGRGVDVAPLSKNIPVYWIQADAPLSEHALGIALHKLQTPYSILNAIRAGIGLRPKHGGMPCVHYANKVLKHNGVLLHLADLTPKTFVEMASQTFGKQPICLS